MTAWTTTTIIDGAIYSVKIKPRFNDDDAAYSEDNGQVVWLLGFLAIVG